MSKNSWARRRVAALIYWMVNAVIFGLGAILVVSIPALLAQAVVWIPAVVVSSLAISAPLAWFIAPLMMLRFTKANSIHWRR